MSDRKLILALDVGTTAIKVGLFESEGRLLRIAAREQTLSFPQSGWVEQSPQEAWRLLAEATREVMSGFSAREVAAISLANHRGTAIALDDTGKPLSEFVVWMDKRGVPWVNWLLETIGAERYYDVAGHPIVSYSGACKLLWFQRSAPEIWEQAAVIAPPQTLFLKWLGCRDLVCDRSTGTFLFPFDIARQTWSESLARQMDFPLDRLPRLVDATEIVGELSAEAASDFGLVPGVPLVAGGGDGQCAGAGSGVIRAGRVMVNIGTGAGVQAFLPQPLLDPAYTLNCAAHVIAGAWEMEGHTQASGASFRWLRDVFGTLELALQRQSGLNAYDLLVQQAADVPPGADGLLFIPTLNGSSAPLVDLDARGSLLGLSLRHERGHVIRAMMEGISLELRWMLDAMIGMGTSVDELRLVGGGASNPAWNQIHADILGHTVTTLRIVDAAMVGAAMCAAVAVQLLPDWSAAAEAFASVADIIEPRRQTQAMYSDLYSRYREAFVLLSRDGLYRRLGQSVHSGGHDG